MFFSNESADRKDSVGGKKEGGKSVASQSDKLLITSILDTKDAANIKYTGVAAGYEIKGFKPGQLDSLKVSLRIIDPTSGQDHRCKVDLYEYSQVKKIAGSGGGAARPSQ